MNKEQFTIKEKVITLYHAEKENAPMIVLSTFTGDGESVYEAMKKIDCPDCNFVVVGELNWDHDMTPWYAPPLAPGDTPCTGGADEYLPVLTEEILPEAKKRIRGTPEFVGITGYSLGGLFAVYAAYKTDAFDRVSSMSGSLWFPEFKEFCRTHEMKKVPDRMYLSLGDKETKTRNPVLKTVQDNTEELTEYFKSLGIEVTYELNPGNHFRAPALRSAKGVRGIL